MQEIEVMGSIDDRGQLLLLQPLNLGRHAKVRVRITLLDEDSEPEVGSEFDPETDDKAKIMADLKESLRQAEARQTYPISALWDGIDV
jgi:hypothetical protein